MCHFDFITIFFGGFELRFSPNLWYVKLGLEYVHLLVLRANWVETSQNRSRKILESSWYDEATTTSWNFLSMALGSAPDPPTLCFSGLNVPGQMKGG